MFFGIGLALLLEHHGYKRGFRGLGLGGAILINISGSGVLLLWLIFADLDIPLVSSQRNGEHVAEISKSRFHGVTVCAWPQARKARRGNPGYIIVSPKY